MLVDKIKDCSSVINNCLSGFPTCLHCLSFTVSSEKPSRFDQSERRHWTRSQANSTSNPIVNYLTWPSPALLKTRDWCVALSVGIIIGILSNHQKTTLKISSYEYTMIHPMLQSVTFSRRPLQFQLSSHRIALWNNFPAYPTQDLYGRLTNEA